MSPTATRLSAAERRDAILDAAQIEFAERGWAGTSTEDIARRAGISQPYLFRLYGTKKELFLACVRRGFRRTLETFQRAAVGKGPDEIFEAMGGAYVDLLRNDPNLLLGQLQSYAACHDPEVREVVREAY